MPKVEIESFWDCLGVELWPNYCSETQKLDFVKVKLAKPCIVILEVYG